MSKPENVNDEKAVQAAVQSCYSTWGSTYYDEYYGANAPYPPIHVDLVKSLAAEATRLLDAGCGPASMLRHLVEPGVSVYGFDLTPEMVVEAQRVMADRGVPPNRIWAGSVLDPASYIPPGETEAAFDRIVCCGVLPHIPEAEDRLCIENLRNALRPGGYAIVEARNELFSLFTLNRYSHKFFLDRLIKVDQLRDQAGPEAAALDEALHLVEDRFRTDLPPLRKGKAGEPGYDEVLSREHHPLLLREQFEQGGFEDVELLFYHFHCLPPMAAKVVPKLFRDASLAMEREPRDWRGLFMASAFLIRARRP